MSKIASLSALSLATVLALTGCGDWTTQNEINAIKHRAAKVKACAEAGGEWFNTPGWGEDCNFDTRRHK